MKPIVLSAKEIRRADSDITIVVRRQVDDKYMVSAVRVSTGLPIFKLQFVEFVDVRATVKEEVRFLDKMCMGGNMSDASRHRYLKGKKS